MVGTDIQNNSSCELRRRAARDEEGRMMMRTIVGPGGEGERRVMQRKRSVNLKLMWYLLLDLYIYWCVFQNFYFPIQKQQKLPPPTTLPLYPHIFSYPFICHAMMPNTQKDAISPKPLTLPNAALRVWSNLKLKKEKEKENRRGRRRVKRVREERVCFVDKNKIGSNRTGGGTWVLVFFSKQKKLREDGFNFQYYLLWASHTSVFGRFVVIGRFPTCKSHLKIVRFQYSTRFTSSTEMVFVLVFGIGHVGDAVNNVLSPKCSQDLDLSIRFCRLNWW